MEKVLNFTRKVKNQFKKLSPPAYVTDLDKLEKQLRHYLPPLPKEPLKVLMGPSFSWYHPCFIHDRLLSMALRLRGASLIPLYCDKVQKRECNVNGGVWINEPFEKSCQRCENQSKRLWPEKFFNPLKLSRFLPPSFEPVPLSTLKALSLDALSDFEYKQMPLGQWGRDILVNNDVVGDWQLVDDHHNRLAGHIQNLMVLYEAYAQIIQIEQPDRVISNDSYYGMWAIFQRLCEQHAIAFYSTWEGDREGGWGYAYNDSAMNLNMRSAFEVFAKQPFSAAKALKAEQWLNHRFVGKGDSVFKAQFKSQSPEVILNALNLKKGKPTAFLPANLVWDLAALNRQIVFDDMMHWIECTVLWFAQHPQYQLIIKPHPAETHPLVPVTKETVHSHFVRKGIKIPKNVALLASNDPLSFYDILKITDLGLVHTTTGGFEMSALGHPVITSASAPYRGLGFTLDPDTPEQYFQLIEKALHKKIQIPEQTSLALKFIYFYRFHFYPKIDFMKGSYAQIPVVNIQDIQQLQKGHHQALDYVIDCILEGQPIVSASKWPPES